MLTCPKWPAAITGRDQPLQRNMPAHAVAARTSNVQSSELLQCYAALLFGSPTALFCGEMEKSARLTSFSMRLRSGFAWVLSMATCVKQAVTLTHWRREASHGAKRA